MPTLTPILKSLDLLPPVVGGIGTLLDTAAAAFALAALLNLSSVSVEFAFIPNTMPLAQSPSPSE